MEIESNLEFIFFQILIKNKVDRETSQELQVQKHNLDHRKFKLNEQEPKCYKGSK